MQTVIEGTELPDDTENSKPKTLNRRFSPDDTYSFSIYVDGNGEILEIDSPLICLRKHTTKLPILLGTIKKQFYNNFGR